ncbi:unnamed protein product [Prorocentrum cordatum]|uniref:Uncharacterized protein n=1 Tax=Prorocentrum cordatum TaxID=2364126 RepID=A0ABN9XM88_9DINO|nr:unnamed protein product [Polarella glacialis]
MEELAETRPWRQYRRGEEVLLPAAAVTLGEVALVPTGDGGSLRLRRLRRQDVMRWVGAEAAGDARILHVSLSDAGRQRTQWRDVVSKSSVTDFAGWPVVGPRTTEWCMMFLNRRGGGPMDHHRYFTMLHGLETGDWGVDTHRMRLKAVEEARTYDHLELCNLASFEVLFRQAQLAECVHEQERVARQTHRDAGSVMLAPELMDFASREVERDANIMKQMSSHAVRRRRLRARHREGGVSGAIATLNELHGASEDLDSTSLRPSSAQLSCLARIEQARRELGSPPADLHGQGALEELLSKQSYGGVAGAATPLEVERVALPSLQRRPARIQDVGGSAGAEALEVFKSLVRAPEDGAAEEERQQLRRAYNDPIVRQKPKEYAKLLRKLHERGIIEHRRSCKKSVGALYVCQALHEAVAERVTGVGADNRLVDGRPAPVVTQGCVHTEYVDNFVALGTDREEGRRLATEVGAVLEADGPGVHPVTCSRGGDALGWHFDELRPAVGIAPRTAWRLILGLREILRRELNMTWGPKVTVFDASEWGYGMMRESGDKSKDNFEGCLRCPGLSGEAAGGVILEARAGVWALRHILRGSKAVGCRHLVLSDATGRCARDYQRSELEQWAALCLASFAAVHARWISSERNAADGASRGSEERSAAACRDAQPRPERAAAWRPGGCPDGGGFELVDPITGGFILGGGGDPFVLGPPPRLELPNAQQRARQRRRRASASSQASASAAAHHRAGASRGVAAAGRRQALLGQELTQLERGVPLGSRPLTVLEEEAKDYRNRFSCFVRWASKKGMSLKTPADADGALVAWLNEQFFEGEPLATGTKMLAALCHLLPGLAAAGATSTAFVLLLLRPAETLRLAGGCLVAPDERMVFDNPEFELVEAVRSATRLLFPSLVAPTLYQLRHGGALHEALTEFRSTEGLMRRGRWHSLRSVKWYEKGGRVNQVLRSLTPKELNAALEAERTLVAGREGFALEIFSGGGRFSHCWRQRPPRGLPIFEIDVSHHCSRDLSSRSAQRRILGWIRSGCCRAAWLGAPCATFSRDFQRPTK